jgi:hypothetical protein
LEKKSTLKSSPSPKLRQQKRTDYWAEERLTLLSTVYLLKEIFIEKNPGADLSNLIVCSSVSVFICKLASLHCSCQ